MAKTPLELANNFNKNSDFVKSRIVNFLQNYASSETDDSYEQWAAQQGKQLAPKKPFDPEFAKTDYKKQYYGDAEGSYSDQYLNDEDFLKYADQSLAADGMWDDYEYAGIDGDYERSYGPVRNDEGYQAYLEWKKQGN